MSLSGMIFDIQGYSVHDGPGCRTVVFLSGCPMRCGWCANPEGQLLQPCLLYYTQRCHPQHYSCIAACSHGAIRINRAGDPPLTIDRTHCTHCVNKDCVNACPHEALKVAGQTYTVDDLMRILLRDQGFWGNQGGLTLSGGEPLFQAEFLLAILEHCRSNYIHTVVETSAYCDPDLLLSILKWTDWLFIDLKHLDSTEHRNETGVGNELILANIAHVAASDWSGRLVIRLPIVPNFNDSVANFQAVAEFMKVLHLQEVNLLPFHRLGGSKYDQLGIKWRYANILPPSKKIMQTAQAIFEAANLSCYLDAATPF